MHCLSRFLEVEIQYLHNLEEFSSLWQDSLSHMENFNHSMEIADSFSNFLQILNIHRKLDQYINDTLLPEMDQKPVDFYVACTSLAQAFMKLIDELKVNYVDFALKKRKYFKASTIK